MVVAVLAHELRVGNFRVLSFLSEHKLNLLSEFAHALNLVVLKGKSVTLVDLLWMVATLIGESLRVLARLPF